MRRCSVTGCNNPVWGKGKCQKHLPKTPLKKTTFRTYKTEFGKVDFVVDDTFDDTFGYLKKRNEFFIQIWNKRPHICEHCGQPLGKEPRSYMFDHILEKHTHRELEYEEENIWLVCLECHDNKNRGMISEKYQEKINFVTTKFNVS